MILNIQDLTFTYKSNPVLANVEFSVNNGELLAILGPNGVGKTSLLKCINTIHKPSSGIVLLHGHDTLSMKPAEIARGISYVAQKNEITALTVFDAVLMGRKPHIHWRVGNKDLRLVDAVLNNLELSHLAMRQLEHLSGGELQKVAIARALVQETGLLLLDEPTSSLDMKNQITILQMLRRVVDKHKIAAIMTMHDLNTALRFADSFLFLKDGSVYAAGRCNDVNASMVREVYDLPVEIHTINDCPFVIPLQVAEPCHAA